MKFILNKDTLEKIETEKDKEMISGSINDYEVEIEYDESWNNLTKEVVIVKRENNTISDVGTSKLVIKDKIFIDQKTKGNYLIGIVGYILQFVQNQDKVIKENEKYYIRTGTEESYNYVMVENPTQEDLPTYFKAIKTYQRSTNLVPKYFGLGAGEIKTEVESLPTPTEWEIYRAEINKIFNDIETLTNGLNEKVEEVETKLENGDFNGKDGVDGKDGYTPQKGIDYYTDKEKEDTKNEIINEITPTLNSNLKESKDYTDNAIIKDFKDISYNQDTCTIVLTRHDNTTFTIDLPIENTVKDGRYDADTEELVLVLVSNQEIRIPATGLIDDYAGVETDTIQLVISATNQIIANIKAGSIVKTLLSQELQDELDAKLIASDLEDCVKNTDYATSSKAGIIQVISTYGIKTVNEGVLRIERALDSDIDSKTNNFKPIVPSNLDYAVGSVKASETQSGTIKAWTSTNEDGEIGLNISTEV